MRSGKSARYDFCAKFANEATFAAACYLVRVDAIPNAEQREWATMMSALTMFAMWKLHLPRDFSGGRNPWNNAVGALRESIHEMILEGIAVLYGVETIRLIPLGDNSDELSSDRHLTMPIGSTKLAKDLVPHDPP